MLLFRIAFSSLNEETNNIILRINEKMNIKSKFPGLINDDVATKAMYSN